MRRVKFKSKEAQNLYDKSFEVMDLIDNIIDIIPPENELQVQMGRQMIDNAMCIIPKIGGAEAGKLYDIRMESAALIRYYAKAILDATTMLEAFDYEYSEYLPMVKEKMGEFKQLYKLWVGTFDPRLGIEDEWGLFNPPGINLDDIDVDDIFDKLDEEDEAEDWWKDTDQ